MVNTHGGARPGRPPIRAAGPAPGPMPERPTIRVDTVVTTPPRRLLFVNQYYWPDHASTAR